MFNLFILEFPGEDGLKYWYCPGSSRVDGLASYPAEFCHTWSVIIILHVIVFRPLTSYPYKAETEHTEFSLDQAPHVICRVWVNHFSF